MAEEKKAPPSAEYSLNNISWHLKRINENLEKLVNSAERISASMKMKGIKDESGDFF